MADDHRTIDLGSGVGLVVASMVGTGVLVANGYMVASLAPWQVYTVWIAQAAMAIAGAVAYAAIAVRMIGPAAAVRAGDERSVATWLMAMTASTIAGGRGRL